MLSLIGLAYVSYGCQLFYFFLRVERVLLHYFFFSIRYFYRPRLSLAYAIVIAGELLFCAINDGC